MLSLGRPKTCDMCTSVSEPSRLPAYLVVVLLEIVLPRWHAQGGLVYLETHRRCDSWKYGGILPAAWLRRAEVPSPRTVPGRTQAPCGRQMLPKPSLSLTERGGCRLGLARRSERGWMGHRFPHKKDSHHSVYLPKVCFSDLPSTAPAGFLPRCQNPHNG